MDEFISANPCSFDHASLFEMVQRLTLDHRLNDTFCSLVSVPMPVITFPWLKCTQCVIFACCFAIFCRLPVSLCCAGMVQSRAGVCLGWVLCEEWSSRLSQTSGLPAWSTGKGRKWGYYWPNTSSLQLRFLCLPCPWEQVCPYLLFSVVSVLWVKFTNNARSRWSRVFFFFNHLAVRGHGKLTKEQHIFMTFTFLHLYHRW